MSNPSDFVIENGVLKKYRGSGGDVVILEGVTSIGNSAFENCGSLTSVAIPEGVTSIGYRAFASCSSLTSVTIPKSVTSIGNSAFSWCRSLTSVTIPESIRTIGNNAFSRCDHAVIKIPDTATNRTENFKVNGSVLEKYVGPGGDVIIPEGVTSIGDSAFQDCSSLTSVIIPEGVTSIGSGAFSYCDSLRSVTIPGSVTSIGDEAFRYCSALERIELKSIAVSLENDPFEGCSKLCMILPEGAVRTNQKLAASLFRACGSLDEEDLAWVLLYQTAKAWKTAALVEAKKKDPVQISSKLLELIGGMKKVPSAAASNMLDFFMALGQKAPAEQLKAFAAVLKEKKCAKQLAALEADLTLQEKLRGSEAEAALSPVERKVKNQLEAEELTQTEQLARFNELMGVKQNELPDLIDASGETCKPIVLAWLLTAHETVKRHWDGEYTTAAWNKPGLRPEAAEIVALLDQDSLQAALIALADQHLVKYQNTKKKFLVYPFCRYANEGSMAELTKRAPKWATGVSGSDAPPLAQLRDAVQYHDGRAAMLFAERYHELDKYAALRGTDADTLRDTVLADFGFDKTGQKRFDLGSGTVTVSMAPDLTLSLYDDKEQKIVKSIPKKGANPEKYEAAKKDLAQMNKNIKKVVKARNDLLLEAYLAGNDFQADRWTAVYTQNPVLNAVARLLVWVQEGHSFTMTDQGPADASGQAYALTDAVIRVAHPMEMQPEEVTAWQKYFNARGLKQPFTQVWEPVIDPATVKQERYKDCMIPYYRFIGQEKHGITVTDEYFHNEINISFKSCTGWVERIDEGYHEINVNDRFEITRFGFKTYTRQVNHIVAYLDRITVWDRVRNDDISVMDMMNAFTFAQIMEFIKTAQEANAVNVLALLLDYKNAHFADFDPMDEFTLEW